jgi:hypothetical protein
VTGLMDLPSAIHPQICLLILINLFVCVCRVAVTTGCTRLEQQRSRDKAERVANVTGQPSKVQAGLVETSQSDWSLIW